MPFLSSASKATKITLGVVAGVVVLIGVVPYVITWNQYKGLITDKVAAQLGREMQINGDVRFSILPRPEAHVSQIVIKNPAGASSQNFLQVEQLDVAMALWPLLHKDVDIEKITLVKPAITLEKMANGANNWTFTPAQKENAEEKAKSDNEPASSLKIGDIDLQDAYIRYVDAAAKSIQTVGPINANLSLDSLQGPYAAKGDLKYNALPIAFDAQVGAVGSDEDGKSTNAMPVDVTFNLGDKAVTTNFKGLLTRGDTLSVAGDLGMQVRDLGDVLNAVAPAAKGQPKTTLPQGLNAFAVQGKILYSGEKIALPGLQIKGDGLDVIADTVVTTGARTNVTTDINRFVLPNSLTGSAAATDATKASDKTPDTEPLAQTLQNGFAAAQKILDIGFPTTPLDVIISSDSITLPGKPPIRDLRLAASSDTNQFTLQSLQAKLNGNTRVSVTAKAPLNAQKKAEQLTATLVLNSDNPALALSNDPAAQAQKADPVSVNATAVLTRQAVQIQPLQVTQQGQTLNGNITYQPSAAMPLNIALRGGALNLDSLSGGKTETAAQAKNGAGSTTEKTMKDKDGASVLNRLKGFKAQFDIAIDKVTTGGKNFSSVAAKGLFSDTGLNLQQAQADLAGLKLNATGTIGKLAPVGDLNLNVQGATPNLSQTLQDLGNAQARNMGASNFTGTVKGDLAKLALNIDAKLDQGSAKIKGDVTGLDQGQTGFDGSVAVSHPDTALIMRNFAKMNPAQALGPFALNATVNYAGDTLKADDIALKLGSAGNVKGRIDVTPQKNGQKNIDATLSADKLNLAALMGDTSSTGVKNNGAAATPAANTDGWLREPINLDAIRDLNGKVAVKIGELLYKDFIIKNFNNDLAFNNGALKLNDLSADLFDAGHLVVNGTLDPAAFDSLSKGQTHKGQFNVNIKDADAAKFFNALDSKLFNKGTFSAQQQLNFSGASPYQIINTLNGDGQVKLQNAVINGLDLDALAAKLDRPNSVSDFTGILQQAKAGGTTNIGNVDVPISIRNGIATIAQTTIKTQLTETGFGGTADLPAKTVNMGGQIQFTAQRNLPPLGLRLTGPFSAPQKNFDTKSIESFFIQKATAKYQDKAVEKLDKVLGGKAGGALGGALGNLLGLPAVKSAAPAVAPAAAPAPIATPEAAAPAPAAAVPAPAPAAETPAQ